MTELYTSKEVAEILKVSQQAVRNMIDRHEIKAVKIGRAYRIPVSEIERITTPKDFVDDNQSETAEPMPAKNDIAQLMQGKSTPLPDSWTKTRKE